MRVRPSGLGGEFSWTNSCCAVSGSGLHFSYGCDGFCLCGGCSARGYYGYEGYRIGCSGGSCGCSWYDDDDRHGEDDPEDPEPTPGVSVSFSKSAVIFEDGYTNMPGQVVQWQSTTTKLTLEAHGGMKGGTATFTFTNKEKLIGPDIPTSITVPAGHCKTYEFTYRGNLPSGSEEDITVHGEFQENNPEAGSQPLTSDDELTSVKVKLEADQSAPDTAASNSRHVYGVYERVNFRHYPSDANVTWEFSADGNLIPQMGNHIFCTPRGGQGVAEVSIGNAAYAAAFDVVEPQVVATNARANASADVSPVNGEAGHLLLCLDVYVTPFYVSFKGLNIQEVPDESQSGPHDGYYDDRAKGGPWSHVAGEHMAGQWNEVDAAGYFGMDRAGRASRYDPPWIQGSKTWPIPMAWSPLPDANFMQLFSPNPTSQHFSISPDGTFRIEKFNHWAERQISGSISVGGISAP